MPFISVDHLYSQELLFGAGLWPTAYGLCYKWFDGS